MTWTNWKSELFVLMIALIIAAIYCSSLTWGKEVEFNLDEWLENVHCTTLLRVEGDRYIVEDCQPDQPFSIFEIEQIKRAIEIKYPIKDKN